MSEILQIEDVEVIRAHSTDQIEIRITAIVDDLIQVSPAVFYPPGVSCPAEFGPGKAETVVTIAFDQLDGADWEVIG
jgi:hypothetical protein